VSRYALAANRLHHLSMRYSGALMELVSGQPVGLVPRDHPGLREARDLIDLALLCRAEINGLVKMLAAAKLIDAAAVEQVMADEYEWLAREKAKFLNVGISDEGIVIQGAGRN
jgi:hypothetical protein